jgi:deazaflavin-dependent oxidoreductase (nitroreductase family)
LRRLLIKGLSRAHRTLYRASGGRILGTLVGMPVLLLTTTGRRTGKQRTTALTFLRDGSDLVLIASNGGADRPPDWWLNLLRNTRAVVQIGRSRSIVTARMASAEERERLWPVITAAYAGYATYQQKTARQIPVVLLTADSLQPGDGVARPAARDG